MKVSSLLGVIVGSALFVTAAGAKETAKKFFQFGPEVTEAEIDRKVAFFDSPETHKSMGEKSEVANRQLFVSRLPRPKLVKLAVTRSKPETAEAMVAKAATLFQKKHPEAKAVGEIEKKALYRALMSEAAKRLEMTDAQQKGLGVEGVSVQLIGKLEALEKKENRRPFFELLTDLLMVAPEIDEGLAETFWTETAMAAIHYEEVAKILRAMERLKTEWSESIEDYYRGDAGTSVPPADGRNSSKELLRQQKKKQQWAIE